MSDYPANLKDGGDLNAASSTDRSRRDMLAGAAGLAGFLALSGGLTGGLAGCATSRREPLPPVTRTARYNRVKPRQDYNAPTVTPESTVSPGWDGVSIRRTAWTRAQPIPSRANVMGRITKITVHHDGMDPFYSSSGRDAVDRIETIRRSHVNRGWADIGYHYIIDPGGRIYEGRPLSLQGAHVGQMNEQNLGVLVLGNFNAQQPTGLATNALERFVTAQMHQYRVPISRVYTHQELKPTECPGVSLQAFMNDTRRRGALARA